MNDYEFIDAWERTIATGTKQPARDLSVELGLSHAWIRKRASLLRQSGHAITSGNDVRRGGECPYCGAPQSRRKDRP